MDNQIQDRALELRREYMRKWRKKNPDKVKTSQDRYWEKKAKEELGQTK